MTSMPQNRRPAKLGAAFIVAVATFAIVVWACSASQAEEAKKLPEPQSVGASSYEQITPVLIGQETFKARLDKDRAEKSSVIARQKKLLDDRYDLTPKQHPTLVMSRGKPIPVGPTTRLSAGMTWEKLAALSPEEIREKGLFPLGFLPLPHPKHEVGGMVVPQKTIQQFARLERFDIDFDLPDEFLPEFPPAMYLTTPPGPR